MISQTSKERSRAKAGSTLEGWTTTASTHHIVEWNEVINEAARLAKVDCLRLFR